MELSYYPGCTLKTKARNFEDSAMAAMSRLGVSLVELPRWNCCGTVFSLAEDDLSHHIAAVRNLAQAADQASDRLVTLCSFCYNTLKLADLMMRKDEDKRFAINTFMEDETDYEGQVEVVHLLQVLRDDVGWPAIAERVTRPLEGLKVAAYYGCTLTRPAEAAIDEMENPKVLEELLETMGATVVDFPLRTECCGSFEIVSDPDAVTERARTILGMAQRQGAEMLVVSCPLCDHNLGSRQTALTEKYGTSARIPIVYFTQLLALALGADAAACRFDLNFGDPETLLREKGLIP